MCAFLLHQKANNPVKIFEDHHEGTLQQLHLLCYSSPQNSCPDLSKFHSMLNMETMHALLRNIALLSSPNATFSPRDVTTQLLWFCSSPLHRGKIGFLCLVVSVFVFRSQFPQQLIIPSQKYNFSNCISGKCQLKKTYLDREKYILHSINMATASARTNKLDHELTQAPNSGKVNLPVFEILKFLKACDFFKKYSFL